MVSYVNVHAIIDGRRIQAIKAAASGGDVNSSQVCISRKLCVCDWDLYCGWVGCFSLIWVRRKLMKIGSFIEIGNMMKMRGNVVALKEKEGMEFGMLCQFVSNSLKNKRKKNSSIRISLLGCIWWHYTSLGNLDAIGILAATTTSTITKNLSQNFASNCIKFCHNYIHFPLSMFLWSIRNPRHSYYDTSPN